VLEADADLFDIAQGKTINQLAGPNGCRLETVEDGYYAGSMILYIYPMNSGGQNKFIQFYEVGTC
jgi:hypothetical protein